MDKKNAQKELNRKKVEAEVILDDEGRSEEFADNIEDRFNSSLKNKNPIFFIRKIKELKEDIPLFISLLRSYIRKEYKEIPLGTIVAVVAALAYFLAPVDVIPDFIPGFGFVDDASVIAFCFLSCKNDIDNYRKWRKQMDVIDAEVRTKQQNTLE